MLTDGCQAEGTDRTKTLRSIQRRETVLEVE